MARPLIAVVTTGGTIAQTADPAGGGTVPTLDGAALLAAVPGLADVAALRVEALCNIDSKDMTPALWLALAARVEAALADPAVAGCIVTHGTDTMEETAFFLDLVVASDKPVVLTGAMRSAADPFPDGPRNLLDAAIQVASPGAGGRGVTVTLNGRIHPARSLRKTSTHNLDAFSSGARGLAGSIDGGAVTWYQAPDSRPRLPRPAALPPVAIAVAYPGADAGQVTDALRRAAAGLVVVGYGSGNVPAPMFEALAAARRAGLPVVVTTRVVEGRVAPVYGGPGGGVSLARIGALFAGDLAPGKARVLLMLGLAHGLDDRGLADLFASWL
ncbi:MAG TPA: asparaginase [Alphaproteobacteria bacterium]|nr:asparaginase [Alphaproteobacteria bacterium]